MILFAFLSVDSIDGMYNRKFASHFYDIRSHLEGEDVLTDKELLSCAFAYCDNLYRRIESGSMMGEDAIPLIESQLVCPDFITPYLLHTGVYSPNEIECGEFEILAARPLLKETTLGALKGKFNQGRTNRKYDKHTSTHTRDHKKPQNHVELHCQTNKNVRPMLHEIRLCCDRRPKS